MTSSRMMVWNPESTAVAFRGAPFPAEASEEVVKPQVGLPGRRRWRRSAFRCDPRAFI